MKAVYLEKAGEALKVVDCPEPKLQPGGVIVKILTAPVLSFMKRVVSGELGYAMAPPWIPGANGVGVVESIANDVGGLEPGDHVFIDPHAYTHTRTDFYDGILIGRFLKKLSGGRPLDRLLLREDKTREKSMALRLLAPQTPRVASAPSVLNSRICAEPDCSDCIGNTCYRSGRSQLLPCSATHCCPHIPTGASQQ